jgi:hypothetical protein
MEIVSRQAHLPDNFGPPVLRAPKSSCAYVPQQKEGCCNPENNSWNIVTSIFHTYYIGDADSQVVTQVQNFFVYITFFLFCKTLFIKDGIANKTNGASYAFSNMPLSEAGSETAFFGATVSTTSIEDVRDRDGLAIVPGRTRLTSARFGLSMLRIFSFSPTDRFSLLKSAAQAPVPEGHPVTPYYNRHGKSKSWLCPLNSGSHSTALRY